MTEAETFTIHGSRWPANAPSPHGSWLCRYCGKTIGFTEDEQNCCFIIHGDHCNEREIPPCQPLP